MIPRVTSGSLETILEALHSQGVVIVENAISRELCAAVREGLYRGRDLVHSTVGTERLQQAGELGVIRAPMLASPAFFELLAAPAILEVVDATLTSTSILHLQNGFILPPAHAGDEKLFQRQFHRDFPRVLNGYLCSLNALIAIDEFTADNGATVVVPGTHQRVDAPEAEHLEAIPAECDAGAVVFFDSTLWHAAGHNATSHDRCAVNQQYTRSYFKQQLDYVRFLGHDLVRQQPPRVQQLLGWYTRVPASLEEYYRADRVYRSGQG